MHDRHNPTYVLAPHDDGTWRRAVLLSQHRVHGEWRVTVSYAVDGFTYWRGMPAGECRPLAADLEDDQQRHGGHAHDDPDHEDDAAGPFVPGDGAHGR